MLSVGALVGTTALTGCAGDPALSDRFVENKGAEAFLDRIEQNCGTLSVGNQQLKYLLSVNSDDTYFVDETSKLYFGRVEKDAYSTDINAFYPTGTNQAALDCIFQQLGE
jgi:hypothetical protein